jgi:menaquinone-dependent protoporphyrinogen oxidase
MKVAIIYATQHGTTETVAKQIQNELQAQKVELINLRFNKTPDLSIYEIVVLGSSIHAGKNQTLMHDFCKKSLSELLQKRIGLFLCCLNEKEFEKSLANAYPDILRNHAFDIQLMGGEYKMDKMNFIERFLVKKIAGITQSQSMINYGNINNFVSSLQQYKNA